MVWVVILREKYKSRILRMSTWWFIASS